ncbi:UDP-glucose 4-epimerase GalE [Niallia oryzisoli]|uniref:UDP-glucose 4-epimerase GalE n=1 Tax=Niallia oryzisoli TaxID=1737571 RepID=UPI0037354C41
MAILVTGGAGYIGSHTCVELLNAGYEIIVVDYCMKSKLEVLDQIREITGKDFAFYQVDLLDQEALVSIFSTNEIEAVIHLAGLNDAVTESLWYYHKDLFGTVSLLEVMQRFQVKNMVYSSTAAVYGIPDTEPLKENYVLGEANSYGRTRQINEELLRDLYLTDQKWSVALLRYFDPVGAHKSGQIGRELTGRRNRMLSRLSRMAVEGTSLASSTLDAVCLWDSIHVVDLANGHVKALKWVLNKMGVEAFNLGRGKGYSEVEFAAAFEKVAGTRIPYQCQDNKFGYFELCCLNPTKSMMELGWVAEKGIEEMCEDTWEWLLKHNHQMNLLL